MAGAHMSGIVENGPGGQVSMLRSTIGGNTRGASEVFSAFASDGFLRATKGGCFVVEAAVGEQDRARAPQELACEWEALSQYWSEGRRTGGARWVRGCPIRVSAGGVGGRRFLAMAPEPVSWDLWVMATMGPP